ncbi:MAG TPA: lysozyme inhibitor LprI family protein [Allosphingosinicella sp.]|jgi:uncharacterized protein YecT (DUF1311 family)
MKRIVPLVAIGLAGAAAPAWDWGDSKDEWASSTDLGKSKAIWRRAAHAAYVEAHGSGEVDLSGIARAAMAINAEEALREELVETVERLRSGRALPTAASRLSAEDSLLNAAYRRRLELAAGETHVGAVTKEGIRSAERAWLRYREAFLDFAAVQYPRVPRGELAAWLTRKQTALLMTED